MSSKVWDEIIHSFPNFKALRWSHNGRDSVSNHQPHDYLLNRLFRRRSKKTSLAFVCGIHRGPVNSLHKWPVTRKMFPFDDVIMSCTVNVWEWTSNFITLYNKCNYFFMLGFKLIHVTKRGPKGMSMKTSQGPTIWPKEEYIYIYMRHVCPDNICQLRSSMDIMWFTCVIIIGFTEPR